MKHSYPIYPLFPEETKEKLFQDGKNEQCFSCVFLLPSHKLNKAIKIYSTCGNPFSSFLLSSFPPFCPVLNSKDAQHVQRKYYFPFIFYFWTATFLLCLQFSAMTDGHLIWDINLHQNTGTETAVMCIDTVKQV